MCKICFFCPDEVGDKQYGWVQMEIQIILGIKDWKT